MGLRTFPATPGMTGPPIPRGGPVVGLFPAPADRVGRDSGRRSDNADPTRPQLRGLRAEPQPPLELRQMRSLP
jgi:hypothetical protein